MSWLAIDSSGARVSVAVGAPGHVAAAAAVEGQRVHAAHLLPLLDRVLAEAGLEPAALRTVVLADGPGSFTGLRVGAAVAKGLVRTLGVELAVSPALLAAAEPRLGEGQVVAGVGDALRGEVYLGAWRREGGRLVTLLVPRAVPPGALAGLLPGQPATVVGWLPEPLAVACGLAWGRRPEPGGDVAEGLLRLAGVDGALAPVIDAEGWEPAYGRPAEAQARWEAEHGRSLPAASRQS